VITARLILSLFIFLSLMVVVFPAMPPPAQATDGTSYYDFIAHASEAVWGNGYEMLDFGGSLGDYRGFACYRDNIKLEDGSTYGRVLETHPQWIDHGRISGRYPEMTLASETELRIVVGFLDGAVGTDGVDFEVYFVSGGHSSLITSVNADYNCALDAREIALGPHWGKTGYFTLWVDAGASSGRDWAAWVTAEIRPTGVVITTECPLPDAIVGHAYFARFEAVGGNPPYHWTISDGSLPPILRLNTDTGAISGTPAEAGIWTFRITAYDSTQLDGAQYSEPKDCYIQVTEPGATPTPPGEFDFSFDVSPTELTLNLDPFLTGTSEVEAQTTATVSLASGIAQSVSLSLSGAPSGSNPYCLPSDGLPPFTSQCGFTAYVTRPPAVGDYDISLSATGGGITKSQTITLHITGGVSGDMDIVLVEPVQVVYGSGDPPLIVPLVAGKGTVFTVEVHSTFSVPVETHFRLSLPDDEWDIDLPYVPPRILPLDWGLPEFWGPVTLNPGENEIILPIVAAGDEEADFDTSLNPAGVIRGTCRGAVGSLHCHTDNRVVPRPIRPVEGTTLVTFIVEVDPYDVVAETNELNNEYYSGAPLVTTRGWKFLFVPYRYMESGCTPAPAFVRTGAQRQLEYLLATFPIADSKITYSIAPYVTDWEEREGYPDREGRGAFLARISRLARSEGHDFAVGIGCGCGGGTMGSWVGAAFIGDCSGEYTHVLAHEFNHQITGMGDFYSYGDCHWGRPYCEYGHSQEDCPEEYSSDGVCSWDQCKDWCEPAGHLYGCPDRRNVAPAADGFWVNRWIPISSQTSAYIMDSCIQEASCTWTWMTLDDMRTCIDTGGCGHRLPDGTIVWGDIGHGEDTHGLANDGYLNLLQSDRLLNEDDPAALLVSGMINKNGTATLDPFLYLPAATLDIEPGAEGEYYIVLLDETGNVLSKSGFEVSFHELFCESEPTGAVDEVPFVYRIEWNEDTKSIELQDSEGDVLASREVTLNKPQINVLCPNGGEVFTKGEQIEISWEASDADGDPLTYNLSISPNGGETWLPIDIDITDNEYEISTEPMDEGQDYLIKVRTTDGVNTGEDVSDGVFTITEGEMEGEEGGISLWLIIVIAVVVVALAGVVAYFLRRPKSA